MDLRRNSGVSLHRQVRDLLFDRVERGDWGSGERIPTEVMLATDLGVHRLTVRRAVESLAREGVLVVRHGSGTYVADPPQITTVELSTSSDGLVQEQSRNPFDAHGLIRRDVLLSFGDDDDSSARHDLKVPRARIVRADSLLSVRGEPWMASSCWFPASLVAQVERDWSEQMGPYAAILKKTDNTVFLLWRSFGAEAASGQDADLLDVPAGSPLLVRQGVSVDGSGRPVLRTRRRARGDRMRYLLHYEAASAKHGHVELASIADG